MIKNFDRIKKVMIGDKEFPKAYLSFDRNFAMMMIIIEDSDEFDYLPIFKYETKRAAHKTTEEYVSLNIIGFN